MQMAGFSAELHTPNSGVLVRPMMFKPAARIFWVRKLSAFERLPCMKRDPISCNRPFIVGPRSFIKNGTPLKAPSGFMPSISGSSTASSKTSLAASKLGFKARMASLACWASSRGLNSPLTTPCDKAIASA